MLGIGGENSRERLFPKRSRSKPLKDQYIKTTWRTWFPAILVWLFILQSALSDWLISAELRFTRYEADMDSSSC